MVEGILGWGTLGKKHYRRRLGIVCVIKRVYVICEGRTEELFVRELLCEPFLKKSISLIPSKLGRTGHKGGNIKPERICFDVLTRLLADKSSFCTTFFDFYALPGDFPGKKDAQFRRDIAAKAQSVQNSLANWLRSEIDPEPLRRFVPYVQMHEFEGLLFSDPDKLAEAVNRPELSAKFNAIRSNFPTPEDINDSYETAPSKRIGKIFPGYQKPYNGILTAKRIGLEKIRRECRLFNDWLCRLETAASH
jgi:hypothetical protein